jgi:glucose-6-phosphate isomerase
MPKSPEPFHLKLNRKLGVPPYKRKFVRRLSDLRDLFADTRLVEKMLARGRNPIIYEVYEVPQPALEGLFSIACTALHPGKIGQEYYFTKGHFHVKELTSEVYIGLKGRGILLMQTREGRVVQMPLEPNDMVYIPPSWAHRTINIGDEKMVFLSIYPSDAGHDYESIERRGFVKLVIERRGKPAFIDNPKSQLPKVLT